MASRHFDFSHLTPDERIELAELLWNSLPIEAIGPDIEQLAELRRRRAELRFDGDLGRPWKDVLDELESGGT
jgi:putative addiction module component (TIGR02574 family)